ncbi:sulfurtransferase [Alcaligenaceae bacterium CGII-47]|nr:sulfurtransferase [Alcaligenaceae bacterium CGII-47]
MKSLFSLFIATAALSLSSAAWSANPLLTPAQLDSIRQDAMVRVIDIRPADAYASGHIPGAVSAPYGQWRGPSDNPGELPSVDKLTALVQGLGLDSGTHAVVVSSGADATDFGGSARVYWTLKYVGLHNLSILNGGLKAWADAGLAQDQTVPTVVASSYVAQPDASLIATKDQVAAQVDNPDTRLIDARPLAFYLGQTKAPTAQVPGTIKNAVNLENGKWFKPGTSIFVSTEDARKIAADALPEAAAQTISFCNTGHWAATDWFALSEIVGQKNVRLYPASLAEWSQDASLPMSNVPGRGAQILDKLKGLIS